MTDNDYSTLERIHKAAKDEFLKKSFIGASLRNIVKTAGVTTGAFYGYYNSKEALFEAMVGDVYDYLMTAYKKALLDFENLPIELQPEQMGNAGRKCMKEILDFSYDHHDELYMILQCSEGTKFEYMVEEMIGLEVQGTHKYYDVLKKLGKEVPYIDERLEHILVTGMMNAYFEMIIHNMPYEDASRYLQELNDFYTAGWIKIMGQ